MVTESKGEERGGKRKKGRKKKWQGKVKKRKNY